CAPYPGCVLRAMQYGAIGQLRDEHFVALAEIEASEDRVDGGRRVIDEYKVIPPGSEKLTDCIRRIAQSGRFPLPDTDSFRRYLTQQKTRRLPLDLVPQPLLDLQHPLRWRANRSMIEIGDFGIEHPMIPHRMPELGCCHAMNLTMRQ